VPGLDLDYLDYESLAKGYGIPAVRTGRPDELAIALKQAFTAGNGPHMIIVDIDPAYRWAANRRIAPNDERSTTAMELGIHFLNFNLPGGPQALGPTLATTARAAEQGGATMFTLADHLFQMDTLLTAEDPFLECYTSMCCPKAVPCSASAPPGTTANTPDWEYPSLRSVSYSTLIAGTMGGNRRTPMVIQITRIDERSGETPPMICLGSSI
jgi:hypothetical protein